MRLSVQSLRRSVSAVSRRAVSRVAVSASASAAATRSTGLSAAAAVAAATPRRWYQPSISAAAHLRMAAASGPAAAASAGAAAHKESDFKVTPATRIGWIGTGVMGVSQAGHLLRKGYAVTVNTRTKARAQPLLDAGAKWADTPQAVAASCDVVFTMLGFPSDVRDVYLSSKHSILSGVRAGAVVCDMTTTEPSLAKEIAAAFAAKGVHAIDAPVSGGDVGAKNATLSIMAGGDRGTYDALKPLLEVMGKTMVYQGAAGAGQHTKMCNQIVIASTMVGVCESLLYGYRAGLHLETMLQSIGGGAAACWTLTNLAPRVLKRNFDPGFFVEHFVKDMGIALAEARRMNLSLPGLALANQLYVAVMAQGHGKNGTHALALALEHMNAVKVEPQPPAAAAAPAPAPAAPK